jgi:NADH-quinone oxidoreductase subunit N
MIDKNLLISLIPLLVLAAFSLIILLIIVIRRNHFFAFAASTGGLLLTFISLNFFQVELENGDNQLINIDAFSSFFLGLFYLAALVVDVFAYEKLKSLKENKEEFYILLLLATLGASLVVISNHFAVFFLGLELISVSLYAMIAYTRKNLYSLEAGVKYLILAGVASAFILFGMALIYGVSGSLNISELSSGAGIREMKFVWLTGWSMLFGGVAFKLALAPFYLWTPDVYEGASTPVTAFIASISKGAVFIFLFRLCVHPGGSDAGNFYVFFGTLAVLSMFAGNFAALLQKNVKRVLAYSSVAHLGYLLITMLAGGQTGTEAFAFYLIAYFISIVGAFGIVSLLPESDEGNIDAYRGMFWRNPYVSVAFTVMLLSLAGIPSTAGFLAKFYVLTAGVEQKMWILLILLVVNSAISLFYYLRIIVAMFSENENAKSSLQYSVRLATVLIVLLGLLIYYGIAPENLLTTIEGLNHAF